MAPRPVRAVGFMARGIVRPDRPAVEPTAPAGAPTGEPAPPSAQTWAGNADSEMRAAKREQVLCFQDPHRDQHWPQFEWRVSASAVGEGHRPGLLRGRDGHAAAIDAQRERVGDDQDARDPCEGDPDVGAWGAGGQQ